MFVRIKNSIKFLYFNFNKLWIINQNEIIQRAIKIENKNINRNLNTYINKKSFEFLFETSSSKTLLDMNFQHNYVFYYYSKKTRRIYYTPEIISHPP